MESKVWFCSDIHFGHKKIIEYTNRPFSNVEEMDKTIINNWNSRIGKNDTVYFLGDFAFSHPYPYIARLNGQKNLILGNHDKPNEHAKLPWGFVKNYHELTVENTFIVLCHYAFRVWNRSHYGSWMLYGHSHGKLEDNGLSTDVGVDSWNYCPVSFDELKEKFKTVNNDKLINTNRHTKEI